MKLFKELTIVTANKPGKLAEALKAIASATVNLIALDSSSGYDLNLVRLVASAPEKARKALEKLGYNVTEATVFGVTISDKPGELAHIASIFARARVNIDYMYASAVAYDQPAMVIVRVANPVEAQRVLRAAKVV